jgi:hypothetical protein
MVCCLAHLVLSVCGFNLKGPIVPRNNFKGRIALWLECQVHVMKCVWLIIKCLRLNLIHKTINKQFLMTKTSAYIDFSWIGDFFVWRPFPTVQVWSVCVPYWSVWWNGAGNTTLIPVPRVSMPSTDQSRVPLQSRVRPTASMEGEGPLSSWRHRSLRLPG